MTQATLTAVADTINAIREDQKQRLALLAVGIGVGLALALFHWIGFLVAGISLGVVARSLITAIAGAVVFGVVIAGGFLGYAWWHGQLTVVLDLGQFTALAVVISFGLVLLGSLIRAVV